MDAATLPDLDQLDSKALKSLMTMVRGNLRETLEKVRYGHGRSLRTRTVGSAAALL